MKKTYISLFSSAGVGCYGFKMNGFECIATNELIERRLNVQKFNNKCKYESGYILGDITNPVTKDLLLKEVEYWKVNEKIKSVDVIIATPPCQGMSVANLKKNEKDLVRNSLVVESIKIINELKPKIFIFENVPAFMKTICTDIDSVDKPIAEAIHHNLNDEYSYYSKVINFKNYGACSSRTRTLVIGVLREYSNDISPLELFPDFKNEKTLREVIGDMKPLLNMGEIDEDDIYHSFRKYPSHMREWIHDLKEGESAFDNEDDLKKPHQVINGKIVINQRKNGDKYQRNYWDKVGPCIHTRNDQLASQNTIHPTDDRVFSIRELMKMMTVPEEFRWSAHTLDFLNNLSELDKVSYLKQEEIKIRQSLGEAVPTVIFYEIAQKIKEVLNYKVIGGNQIKKIIKEEKLDDYENLIRYIKENPQNLSFSSLSKIAELANTNRTDNAAFYTNKFLITEMVKHMPDFTSKESIRVLEPSAGVGNFVSLLLKKYENKIIEIDVLDIDENSLNLAKILLNKKGVPQNCKINYIVDDFLLHEFDMKYDLVVGNPPFNKLNSKDNKLKEYKKNAINKSTNNICSFFLDKIVNITDYTALVFPKFLLNTPEFKETRDYLEKKSIECILDFGEKGFNGVLIETIALFVNNISKPKKTIIESLTHNIVLNQKQKYIFDSTYPYWLIYRNELFDTVAQKLDFDVFTVFRDRQLTNAYLKNAGEVRVLKSRNISDDGSEVFSISGYDSYVNLCDVEKMSVYKFLNRDDVYLTPNMTYKPRVIKKEKGYIVNGSVAILIPKFNLALSEEQRRYFASDEYREFYKIARNYQTRSLNVDSNTVFFYGILKE